MLPSLWAVVATKNAARLGVLSLALVATSQAVSAQTWSVRRERPALFEIVDVDATSETDWPYGREDVAGDGANRFDADEAAVDLRSVYADARANELWLRAYVASNVAPPSEAVAFFFIDTDARSNTGGKAEGMALWPAFDADPSPGGYERAVGLRGDGTLVGVYFWNAGMNAWVKQPERPQLAVLETGVARDPLRFGRDEHGYFQVELELPAFELDEACDGTIFVRLWNDVSGARSFGDETEAARCKPRLNSFGDPEVLQTASCKDDDVCPARGQCRDGTCVFGYDCSEDTHCRSGERCEGNVCVRVVDKTCDDADDCDGLVCASGQCTTCRDSGGRACADGLVCTPGGSCIRPSNADGGRGGSAAGSGAAGDGGPQVRGGAFTCSAGAPRDAGRRTLYAWLALAGLAFVFAVRRRGAR